VPKSHSKALRKSLEEEGLESGGKLGFQDLPICQRMTGHGRPDRGSGPGRTPSHGSTSKRKPRVRPSTSRACRDAELRAPSRS
jgi:hypothetical protein